MENHTTVSSLERYDPGKVEGLVGMLDTLPGAAYRCLDDPQWTMTWVSAGMLELTGYEPAEMIGNRVCSYGSLIHPDDQEAVAEEVSRAASLRDRFRMSYRIRHRDGRERWVWEQGRALRGADDRVECIEGFITDITPLVQARQERDEHAGLAQMARAEATAARAHFRALFEAAPGQFLVLAVPDYRIVAVSNSYLHGTGTRREDLVGLTVFQAFPDDPAEAEAVVGGNLRASLERVLAFRIQDAMAIQRYPIPDGSGGFEERYWSPVNAPVIGDDGRVHYIIHRVEDVTDYVRARADAGMDVESPRILDGKEAEFHRQAGALVKLNEGLRASEALFRRVFDEAPLGIGVVHTDGVLALANATLLRMLGASAEKALGKPLALWLHPADRDSVAARDASLAASQRPGYDAEEHYLASDGRDIWLQVGVTALRDASGGVTSFLRVAQDISEQKRLAEELRRRQTLTEMAGRLALVGGWAVDLGTNSFEWSDELHRIVGWPHGDAPPSVDQVWELHPPEWRGPLSDALHRCMTEGVAYRIDARLVTPAGEEKWVAVAAEAEVDGEGRVQRVVGIVQDITARKAAEDELDRVAVSLRSTLDSMSEGFYLLDHDWRFVFVNPQAERLLGRDAAGLVDRVLWEEFPEAAETPVFEAYRQSMQDGRPRSLEAWYEPLATWLEISASPSPQGLGVYFRDITDRKALGAQLTASEERFRYVAEATTDAVWDWNLRSDAVWWSNGVEALFGHPPQELEPDSSSWTSRIHPEDLDRVLHSIHGIIDGGGRVWRDEYRFRCRDGGYARVVDRGTLIRDESGQPVRMVGGMTDISGVMALEEQLRQSQRLEAVGKLTGGLAHDFNNLLTVILGNAEELTERLGAQPDLRELADMVGQAALRGAQLTSHLLAFARKQALEPQSVNANQLLAGMNLLLRRTLGGHIEIELAGGGGLWTAMVDATQLESAVLNLCINARDAMPHGGRLTIETSNVRLDHHYTSKYADVEPGQYVLVAVSDTGSGIPEDLLDRVFEPFFTTKETGKGTGLGLSMVYGFVKQSRGHVTIYSEEGEGTTVKLYLPRSFAQATATGRLGRDDALDTAGGIETILLVEDDALVRRYAHAQLLELGYQVVAMANGADALEVLRSDAPLDLLFTDVIMPGGISGRQLADTAAELRPGLPVLYTSGYTENAVVHHGRLDPGVQLLAKPYRKADLARRVRDSLSGVHGGAKRSEG